MSQDPIIFLKTGRPASANKTVPEKYKEDLRSAYSRAGGSMRPDLKYGSVYWFVRRYNVHRHPDADNISKPVWDALRGAAYDDDKKVRLRVAAIIDLGAEAGDISTQGLDLTDVPQDALAALLSLIAIGEDDFLYVEIGTARAAMLPFNMSAKVS